MRRPNSAIRASSIAMLAISIAAPIWGAQDTKPAEPKPVWEASGTLFEACSCSVPCPCNFRQSPSRSYCYTVYAYRLKSARYGGVKLDGLVFGGGEADKKPMGFLDARAVGDQKPALEKLALAVFGQKAVLLPANEKFVLAKE